MHRTSVCSLTWSSVWSLLSFTSPSMSAQCLLHCRYSERFEAISSHVNFLFTFYWCDTTDWIEMVAYLLYLMIYFSVVSVPLSLSSVMSCMPCWGRWGCSPTTCCLNSVSSCPGTASLTLCSKLRNTISLKSGVSTVDHIATKTAPNQTLNAVMQENLWLFSHDDYGHIS